MAERTKGFVQFDNRLLEALIGAGFVGAQILIVLVLSRLTLGWRRRTVTTKAVEIAKRAGLAPTGGFRRALRELVQNNVVLELRDGGATSYALNLDYTNWGRFAAAEAKLTAIWDSRPASDDGLLKHLVESGQLTLGGQLSGDQIDDDDDPVGSPDDHANDPVGSPQISGDDPTGSLEITHRVNRNNPQGRGTEAKSLFDETVGERKDIEIQERQRTTTTAARVAESDPPTEPHQPPDDAELVRQYAIKLSTAVNAGITTRWGEQPNPITYATGLELAGELRKANVPIELARATIDAVCQASKKDRPMSTISYFRQPIMEAARVDEQRLLNAADPGTKRGGGPKRVANVIDGAEAIEQQEQLELAYLRARRAATYAWMANPENKGHVLALEVRVNSHHAGWPDSDWVKKSREEMLVEESAKAAQFPERETWIQQRRYEPPQDEHEQQPAGVAG